jgi:L-fuconolactonase
VGHLLPHAENFAGQVQHFAANPTFRGIRVSGDELLSHIATDAFLKGATLLAERGLSLDVNGLGADGLTAVIALAAKLPELRIMLDHCAGCGDAARLKESWLQQIRAAGKQRNIWCKVSALVEQTTAAAGQAPAETSYYLPVLNHLWESFGQQRLVFGSNWPVSDKGASFHVLFHIVADFFTSKGQEACELYFWKNATEIYGVK